MKNSRPHPTRAALLKAVRTGRIPFREHLKHCPACRSLFELLRAFPLAGQKPLCRPSAQAMSRLAAIPALVGTGATPRRRTGNIEFDSWSHMPALQLRDLGPGSVRRLSLKAGRTTLELVAEQHEGHWEFTARVYQSGRVSSCWALSAGGRRLLPQSMGFYLWTARQAPRTISISNDTEAIEFGGLSWG